MWLSDQVLDSPHFTVQLLMIRLQPIEIDLEDGELAVEEQELIRSGLPGVLY